MKYDTHFNGFEHVLNPAIELDQSATDDYTGSGKSEL